MTKKPLFVVLTIAFMVPLIILIGCRDKTLRSLTDYSLSTSPYHCFDGVVDSGEVDIDCGGTCPVCNQLTAPCSIGADSMDVVSTGNYLLTGVNCGTVNSGGNIYYEFSGTCSFGTLVVDVEGPVPSITTGYTVSSDMITGGVANVYVNSLSYNNMQAPSGTVTVNWVNGKYSVTCCNIAIHSYVGYGYDFVFNAKIGCN
jgi:hypothetical protein